MNSETEKLIREVEEIKELELQAETFYGTLAQQISDAGDRAIIEGIAKDERKHAQMAESIIRTLKS